MTNKEIYYKYQQVQKDLDYSLTCLNFFDEDSYKEISKAYSQAYQKLCDLLDSIFTCINLQS